MKRRRDPDIVNFSKSGGYWRRPDRSGRARDRGDARDRAYFDHEPPRGVLGRLANKLRGGDAA